MLSSSSEVARSVSRRLVVHEVLDDGGHRGLLERGRGRNPIAGVRHRHGHLGGGPGAGEPAAREGPERGLAGRHRRVVEQLGSPGRGRRLPGTIARRDPHRVGSGHHDHLQVDPPEPLEDVLDPVPGGGSRRVAGGHAPTVADGSNPRCRPVAIAPPR